MGEARLADRGERRRPRDRARVARRDAPRDPRCVADGASGPGASSRGTTGYVAGAAARRLDRLVTADRLAGRSTTTISLRWGRILATSGSSYDILPRPGRPPVPVAFTLDMGAWASDQPPAGPWTPRPPWVFATYAEGGIGNLLELLHESGHALHAAADPDAPGIPRFRRRRAPGSSKARPMCWAGTWTSRSWQRRWLGEAAEPREALLSRYGAVMLDVCWALFEIEIHRHPERRPNDVWTEVTADGLGVEPHPEWSWWAIRGQLINEPGYLANYALSAIMAAAVRARIVEVRGPWFDGDPGWYRFVADALFAPGASAAGRPPRRSSASLSRGPLSPTCAEAASRVQWPLGPSGTVSDGDESRRSSSPDCPACIVGHRQRRPASDVSVPRRFRRVSVRPGSAPARRPRRRGTAGSGS